MKPTRCTPKTYQAPSEPADDSEARRQLALWAKALGHPARVQIVEFLLARRECVCGAIVDEVGLAQSTVSQHLKVLKAAGILQGEIDGPRTCYCVNPLVLAAFARRLSALTAPAQVGKKDAVS